MVDKNDSLLREVDDELRNDQLKKLWNDYGTYFIGAAAAFVVGVGVYQQVQGSRLAAAQAAGSRYEAARSLLADHKAPEAGAAFAEIIKAGPSGYATLARFQQAASDAKADKITEAIAAYDAIAGDTGNGDAILRDLARLQAAALRLDGGDWTEMQNRLTPLVDERNAFRANARELLGLSARKADKTEDARKLFLQVLGDAKASKALKDRVSGYMAGIVAADLSRAMAPIPQPGPAAPVSTASEPDKIGSDKAGSDKK